MYVGRCSILPLIITVDLVVDQIIIITAVERGGDQLIITILNTSTIKCGLPHIGRWCWQRRTIFILGKVFVCTGRERYCTEHDKWQRYNDKYQMPHTKMPKSNPEIPNTSSQNTKKLSQNTIYPIPEYQIHHAQNIPSWMVTRRERNYIPTKIVPHTSGNTSTWFMLRKKKQIWIIWVITVHLKIASDANVQRFRLFVSIPVITW